MLVERDGLSRERAVRLERHLEKRKRPLVLVLGGTRRQGRSRRGRAAGAKGTATRRRRRRLARRLIRDIHQGTASFEQIEENGSGLLGIGVFREVLPLASPASDRRKPRRRNHERQERAEDDLRKMLNGGRRHPTPIPNGRRVENCSTTMNDRERICRSMTLTRVLSSNQAIAREDSQRLVVKDYARQTRHEGSTQSRTSEAFVGTGKKKSHQRSMKSRSGVSEAQPSGDTGDLVSCASLPHTTRPMPARTVPSPSTRNTLRASFIRC